VTDGERERVLVEFSELMAGLLHFIAAWVWRCSPAALVGRDCVAS